MSENLLDLASQRLMSRIESGDMLIRLLDQWFRAMKGDVPIALGEGQGVWQYREVALAALREATGQMAPRAFADGLAALRRREYFMPHRQQGFEADPLAILAVAIGIREMDSDHDAVSWLDDIVLRALDLETDTWRKGLLISARVMLGRSDGDGLPPVIRVALSSKGLMAVTHSDPQSAQKACLSIDDTSSEEAVFRFATLQHLLVTSGHLRLGALDVVDVMMLLRSVEAALRRWPWELTPRTSRSSAQKWDIQNEYHVQAILWALLRPVFPDLTDEEYLKSIGYKHPRVDLAIPSLRLVIEVKYLYLANQSALSKVTGEIAEDATLYLSQDNGFDHIVVFVWDATGSVQHHTALEAGMRKLKGIVDAVVVSRPGGWK